MIAAYGHDIRSWEGTPVRREIRELSGASALLRDGYANMSDRHERQDRLRSLRTGGDLQWTAF